jgi:hypothetical protein
MSNYSSLVFLELLAGYVICILVAVIGLVVVWKIATNQIDISRILTEKDAGATSSASMSRFQLLIFIFVISLSFFLVVISNIKIVQANPNGKTPALPEVPNGVLGLLGISASSYAVGKAIQHGAGTGTDDGEGEKKP